MPSDALSGLQVEFGNAGTVDTNGTGWFVGFSDWCKCEPHDLRHMPSDLGASGVSVKWFHHPAGDPNGQEKPVSSGRTVAVMVSDAGRFQIDFCALAGFPPEWSVSHTLRRTGDFVVWGPGIFHRSFGIQAATILTIRWELDRGANR